VSVFQYSAMDHAGKQVSGSLEAGDEAALSKELTRLGLFLVEAEAMEGSRPLRLPGERRKRKDVPLEDVILFTKQLILLLKSSLPIVQSIDSLAMQQKNLAFRKILYMLSGDLTRGLPPSQSFARHPEAFDQVFVSLVSAGEASGRLPELLARIEEYLNFQSELKHKVRTALMYPAVLASVSFVVIMFLMVFVLPTFVDIFNQFDAPLPWATRVLLNLSLLIRGWWWLGALLVLGAGFQVKRWLKVPQNQARVDHWMLAIPIIGPMVDAVLLARMLRTLSVLVESRVPILKALALTRGATQHDYYRRLLDKISDYVSEGRGLAAAMYESARFPRSVSNMVATAQRTGNLPEVLKLSADHYQKELDKAIQNAFSALEPLFIAVLSVTVATIVLCVLQPIMSLGSIVN